LIAEIGAALACMFLLTITSRKRRSMVTLAAVLFMVLAAVTGCATSNNNGGGNPGTTLGAYTVTVTATPSSGTAQTSAITVNVK
jgi:ABC-type transporter Mla subunit MlaD